MQIPRLVSKKIEKDHALDAFVRTAISKVSDHISANKMVFFPEYTDHSLKHIQDVLNTAFELPTDASHDIMSGLDNAILAVAVCLHDFGMYLTRDGFQSLIAKDSIWRPISGFSDKPWHELWLEFLIEAKRFDSKKLLSLFGEGFKPVTSFPSFDEAWNDPDYLLVGEFLRKHHPRLAHEIAIYGLPGIDGQPVKVCDPSPQNLFWADLAGLVARSHGMPLRDTFEYLHQRFYNRIDPKGAHPIYLMVLLRIADYLQIQSTRAPFARTDVSRFSSPISSHEWSLHQCVTDLTNTFDPEALDLVAMPGNVDLFLKVGSWVVGLQRELDNSWAVLGEVYGLQNHNKLNDLGIRIRRIRSNIDDAEKFGEAVDYIPSRISFDTSGADLLKLLVGPLYGNEVRVGLRELVQNSTDAVKELEQLIQDNEISEPDDRWNIGSDVVVEFVESTSAPAEIVKIVITDRGTGMNLMIIRDYFLRAGASFRKSDYWKNLYQNADGTLKMQRSGRFGVGALAVFLLGDTIKVTTRHHRDQRGYVFTAGIETQAINLERTDCSIGTRIEVDVPPSLRAKVKAIIPAQYQYKVNFSHQMAGYFGRSPSCSYVKTNKVIPVDEACLLPDRGEFTGSWNFFETSDFEVHWSFKASLPAVLVNKITVVNEKYQSQMRFKESKLRFPSISVGDKAGNFPLNLQRNQVAAPFVPFEVELTGSLAENLITEFVLRRLWNASHFWPDHAALWENKNIHEHTWYLSKEGVVPGDIAFVREYGAKNGAIFYGSPDAPSNLLHLLDSMPEKSLVGRDMISMLRPAKHNSKGNFANIFRGNRPSEFGSIYDAFDVVVRSDVVDAINLLSPGLEIRGILHKLVPTAVEGWAAFQRINPLVAGYLERFISMAERPNELALIGFYRVDTSSNRTQQLKYGKAFFERWMSLVGVPYLPLDVEKLKQLELSLQSKLGRTYRAWKERFEQDMERKRKAEEEEKARLDRLKVGLGSDNPTAQM